MNNPHPIDTRPLITGDDPAAQTYYQDLVSEYGSPLLVLNGRVLKTRFKALQAALPEVDLYYAVKAHPDPEIIKIIDQLGGGFDIASAGEMSLLLDHKVSGRRTIHTHPIKKDQEIRDGLRFGATTFVIDNVHELKKLVPYRSRVGVLLRVSFRSASAIVDLSKKFGCAPDEVSELVQEANALGIHVKGLSFHVGSQCHDASKHVEAISRCHRLMQEINETANKPLSVLDIGGGFPADYELKGLDIEAFCMPIRAALAELPRDWHLIAEPGRYLVAPSVTSVTTVAGKSMRNGFRWYYLDDGIYGSYSGQLFDHATYPLQVFRDGERMPSIVAGPTCDSIDVVAENIGLPELEIGDLVIGHQMGAYTAATKTRFNSIPDARLVVVDHPQEPPVLVN
ncbi:ornithine decarboxylase [Arenicella chitinivorans]|uniref:ornithine decarboxylase n=1 Tax=Arenicella chitinivorans TaxID=1329800 RepID=A0A918S0C2_9GAMM|nr:type III PLP-dependent enzyme [Arenicella chitinivorans]GHA15750.1 ornithine decarboxylase [Arenicella chitinivorans]